MTLRDNEPAIFVQNCKNYTMNSALIVIILKFEKKIRFYVKSESEKLTQNCMQSIHLQQIV